MKTILIFASLLIITLTACTMKKSLDNNKTDVKETFLASKWVLLNENEAFKNYKDDSVYLEYNTEYNSISGNSSCNGFSGSNFSIDDAKNIQFGMMMQTKRYCPDMNIEQNFMKLLHQSNKYDIIDTKLYLYKDELLLLTFKKVEK